MSSMAVSITDNLTSLHPSASSGCGASREQEKTATFYVTVSVFFTKRDPESGCVGVTPPPRYRVASLSITCLSVAADTAPETAPVDRDVRFVAFGAEHNAHI